MVQITYKKKGISLTQVWFQPVTELVKDVKTAICFYHGIPEKVQGKNMIASKFHTLMNDLTQDEEVLQSQINKNVRYEIRRNYKEECEYKVFDAKILVTMPEVVTDFGEMYESMYHAKGLSATFNRVQMDEYIKADGVVITAIYAEGKPLVYHSYIVGKEQVRLLHSVSDFRSTDIDANLVARANKRLHWDDMCLFKNQGKKYYDWGGVSSLDNPNGIDSFKFKFGGSPLTYYNVYQGRNFVGKLAITLLKIKNGK